MSVNRGSERWPPSGADDVSRGLVTEAAPRPLAPASARSCAPSSSLIGSLFSSLSSSTGYRAGKRNRKPAGRGACDGENTALFEFEDNSEADSDSDPGDRCEPGFELKQRNPKRLQPDEARGPKRGTETGTWSGTSNRFNDFIIHEISSGDSLQSLALKCGCSVSDLKRANNLMVDQDFHALKNIRIPIKKYGLLSEVLVHQINSSNGHSQEEWSDSNGLPASHSPSAVSPSSSSSSSPRQSLIVSVGLKRTFNSDSTGSDVNKYMANLDKDLEKIRKKVSSNLVGTGADSGRVALHEETGALDPQLSSVPCNLHTKASTYDGADCGLTWYQGMALALFVCILVPVIFLIFKEEIQLAKEHDHPSNTSVIGSLSK